LQFVVGVHRQMADFDFEPTIEAYCEKLAPLFQCTGDRFDFVLALLRATGHEKAGWDTLPESWKVLDDLHFLASAELPSEYFGQPELTRLRLRLLEYCHLVEMDAPYEIIANLCRVKLGMPPSHFPFSTKSSQRRQNTASPRKRPAKALHPADKISAIKALTRKVGLANIGTAFDDFYRAGIRNAISHSDYIIHGDEFRMRNQTIPSEDGTRQRTSVVQLARLEELINIARAFFLAFVRVEKGARLSIGQNKGRGFAYDLRYKGILEIVVDEEEYLCGAVIHWPNGIESSYLRTGEGSRPLNLLPLDGKLEAFVGTQHSPHDPFSPLLKPGDLPRYTPLRDHSDPLNWPN
jgi:hypothetical protein